MMKKASLSRILRVRARSPRDLSSLDYSRFKYFVGIDEVGRGSLAGPICAVATLAESVSWSFRNFSNLDSKRFSEPQREELARDLSRSILWGWGSSSQKEIDRWGIERANMRAMERALQALLKKHPFPPEKTIILVDGNRLRSSILETMSHVLVIRGDALVPLIGAASLLAKTKRDALMRRFHKQYPHYLWEQNKGYGTRAHRAAIKKHGYSPLHRISFLGNIVPKTHLKNRFRDEIIDFRAKAAKPDEE